MAYYLLRQPTLVSGRRCISILCSLSELRTERQKIAKPKLVGFVPTMGALHEGHISLVEEAKRHSDVVLVSIFVNPKQFAPHEDFDRYPRSLETDAEKLETVGADYIFAPTMEEMYPPNHRFYIVPEGFDSISSEGGARPGFFRGVSTVVSKLFNMVQPDRAFFGQKDAMQCVVIKKMVQDLNFPVDVHTCPTIREKDGLAMSSRNAYLKPNERPKAVVLYNGLKCIESEFNARMTKGGANEACLIPAEDLRTIGMKVFEAEPLVDKVEYLSIGDRETMDELKVVDAKGAIVAAALHIGSVRLIDNIFIGPAR